MRRPAARSAEDSGSEVLALAKPYVTHVCRSSTSISRVQECMLRHVSVSSKHNNGGAIVLRLPFDRPRTQAIRRLAKAIARR